MDVAGQPALFHLLDRAVACRHVDKKDVVVCTTEEPADDPLVDAVAAYGAGIFRGPTDDLIRRLHNATIALDFAYLVEADGDDLCCATEYMDLCFEILLADAETDVVTCAGLPLGVAPRGFTRAAIEQVCGHCESRTNDTGFFHLFTKTGLCRETSLPPRTQAHIQAEARLTLDYPEDLEFFRQLLSGLGSPGAPAPLDALVGRLESDLALIAVNSHMNEAFWKRTAEKTRLAWRDRDGKTREITV